MALPKKIIAGDNFHYEIASPIYTNTDGYTVYLKFAGPRTIAITGSYDSAEDHFDLSETAVNTAMWSAGKYKYVIYASDGTNQYTLESGSTEIELRIDLDPTTDVRSHAQKVLDAIEAVIEGRASKDQQSYTINGRNITRLPIADLLEFRRVYRQEVKRENGKFFSQLKIRM